MIEYYLPGLDASKLSDEEFIQKLANLLTIRKLERDDSLDKLLKNLRRE